MNDSGAERDEELVPGSSPDRAPMLHIQVGPFRREGLLKRSMPFMAMAVLAEASLALPPGPTSAGCTIASVLLLATVLAAVLLVPWEQLPRWVSVLVPVAYVSSVLMLILATGSSNSGIGIVILVPLVWSVLFHRRWESFVVLSAIIAVEIITSLTPVQLADAVILRRIAFWFGVGLLIALASHDLRDRARASLAEREGAMRRTEALAAATERLTMILDSNEVIESATRLAAQLVAAPGQAARRAQYTRIVGPTVKVIAQYDETGQVVSDFPLADNPNLQEVLRTGGPLNRPLDGEGVGPEVRALVRSLGLTHGVYVPVYVNGVIDGVLAVPFRGQAIPDELFEYFKAVGHLMELALGNARSHELLAAQATTDALTGLSNRRAFDQQIVNRPGRLIFCLLVLDLDGLKKVNDTQGHVVGDELLVHFARVLSGTLRAGDVFARLGGDEFAALLFNADVDAGREAALRMLSALDAAPFRGQALGVSIGVASGDPWSSGPGVFAAADAAMYEAKRNGGRQYVLAEQVRDFAERSTTPG
ncbi:MAG TPA: GGDEF domain-containing protein [Acidimicrobiales bacterium]